jgi:hypothetical protein
VAHRWVRIAAAASTVMLTAWAATILAMVSDGSLLTSKLDVWLTVLKLASLVVFVGSALVAVWHARVVWSGGRRWLARTWSVVLAASSLVVLLVAVAYKLVGYSNHF